jgi:hypothetical protein
MSKKLFLGIDNGITGTIGVTGNNTGFYKMPVFSAQNYTIKKANVTRVDTSQLKSLLLDIVGNTPLDEVFAAIERPMINPQRFVASQSAIRALEATLICMEELKIPFRYIDSKEWQKRLLPKGVMGSEELKKASKDIGSRLFPAYADFKHGDRDGLLIAEHLRTMYDRDSL